MVVKVYDATIRQVKGALATLAHILKEAESQPNSDSFTSARLYEDMKPLTFQVHSAAKYGDIVAARLSGREPVEYKDELVSYADMHERINTVMHVLDEVDEEAANGRSEELQKTQMGPGRWMDVSHEAFTLGAAMPNILFHVSMTYAILRKEGVPLGKADFVMSFVNEYVDMST